MCAFFSKRLLDFELHQNKRANQEGESSVWQTVTLTQETRGIPRMMGKFRNNWWSGSNLYYIG